MIKSDQRVNDDAAQELFNELIKFLSGSYIAAQQQMIKGLFDIEKTLGEIVESEGLPPGVSDETSFIRGAKYVILASVGLKGDPQVISAAIRDADMRPIIDLIQKVTGGAVNNTTNLILPKSGGVAS